MILLERGEVAGEQSGRNWGFVRQQGRDPSEVPLMVAANRIWRGLEQELEADIEWIQGGNLALAPTPERLALFEGWLPTARENGLDTRLVSRGRSKTSCPAWRDVGRRSLHPERRARGARQGDAGLRRAAVKLGVAPPCGCAVESIDAAGGRIGEVRTEQGSIRAATVVCAAGAGRPGSFAPSGSVSRSAGSGPRWRARRRRRR